MDMPTKIKHYDFLDIIYKTMGTSKEEIEERIEIKERHSKFLNKFKLDRLVNWYF